MAGYWNKPGETATVMRDGWFLTGDIGVMDADGYFTIVDRKKDMVVVSGFNVYPNEVEDCLALHPGILEAADRYEAEKEGIFANIRIRYNIKSKSSWHPHFSQGDE